MQVFNNSYANKHMLRGKLQENKQVRRIMDHMQDMQRRAAEELISEHQKTIHIAVSETIIKAIQVVVHP